MISTITFFGAGTCLLWCLSEIVKKRKGLINYVLSFLFLNLAIRLAYSQIIQNNVFTGNSGFFYLHIPAVYFIGPLLITYYRLISSPDFNPGTRYRFFFLLPVIIFVLNTLVYIFTPDTTMGYLIQFYTSNSVSIFDILFIIGTVINAVYYIPILMDFNLFLSHRTLQYSSGKLLAVFFICCTGICILELLAIFFKNEELMHLAAAIVALLVIFAFLISSRYPELMSEIKDVLKEAKYTQSLLSGIDTAKIDEQLSVLMETDSVYRDSEYSLNSLSAALGLTRNQLSQHLNLNHKKNFKTYMNGYRIREAKQLLLDNNNYTVLDIAYRVGFNSKSSFNSVFYKFTRMTPTDFRVMGKNYD